MPTNILPIFSRIILIIASVALTACVSPEKVDLDKAAGAKIKKIALLKVNESQDISVMNEGDRNFGRGSARETNSKILQLAINERKILMGPLMSAKIKEEFLKKGIEVSYLENQNTKFSADEKSVDYSLIETDVDAILHVWFDVTGYASPLHSTEYEPWIQVGAKLVDARSKQVLYYRIFKSGYGKSHKDIYDVGYNKKYRFGSFDLLMRNADEAIEGILNSHRMTATKIAEQIK